MKAGFNALGGARAQAAVLLTLAFLAGAVAGGATQRLLVRRAWEARGLGGRGPGSGMMGGGRGFMRQDRSERGGPDGRGGPGGIYADLGLSDAQRAKLDSIVAKRRDRVDSVMKSAGAVMRAAMDSTRKEIESVLTPEQRAKADSLRGSRRGGMMRGRGGSGPGGDSGMRGPGRPR